MDKYNPQKTEKKWQKYWENENIFRVRDDFNKPKKYILDMFPYPSGVGLHVGHPKGYIATDVISRMKMAQGYNVLHPMGWDAFGLPAENYALKNHVHPREAVERNVATFKRQLEQFGFTYDWGREINTTCPQYYKWTQWAFLQMFKRGLAFESNEPINWCPSCQTGLANEDLEDGKCERCETVIERKPMRQWVLKITAYAERLLNDLEKLPEWQESIKDMQRNWIGKSEGAEVFFNVIASGAKQSRDKKGEIAASPLAPRNDVLNIFTTRPDTLFGVTYMVVAPEHFLVAGNLQLITNRQEVEKYIAKAKNKSDLERADLTKEKTGVELKGVMAVNPVNGEELPIWMADYVIMGYGTGAIMAVPGHDERDWEFAKKYNLEIKEVVKGGDVKKSAFTFDGISVNSDFLNNLSTAKAKEKMIQWLEKNKVGKQQVNYKIRDWVFSRQRYWGEPIPLIHCEKCGWVAVPEKDLPVELPKVDKYEPTGTGESPLAKIDKWVNTKCPQCGEPAKRETNTMPQWAGSCWYYLRYIDAHNNKALVDEEKEKYWSPVDIYVGGAEHVTRHLIYARFWHKFLFDIGAVSHEEPFTKMQHVGLILAEDGRKMSKRWGNVINPDDVILNYGADAMRVYEMFMGPFDQPCAWSTQGLVGVRRFLDKVWGLVEKLCDNESPIESLLHQTIRKITSDIDAMRFNTAISALMILTNALADLDKVSIVDYKILLQLLSPFAPHMCEELWQALGEKKSIIFTVWPKFDAVKAKDLTKIIVVQVNGKLRDQFEISTDELTEETAKDKAIASSTIQKWLAGQAPKKVIYVKEKLVNIVVSS
ncbi:MAG: leucine--tRNA ligase [Candidatus Magasanikbacteria bacterium]|nr:leucine--tRNA ligase [Candidatus Magasanikbacteria bacterium]